MYNAREQMIFMVVHTMENVKPKQIGDTIFSGEFSVLAVVLSLIFHYSTLIHWDIINQTSLPHTHTHTHTYTHTKLFQE